MKFFFKIWMKRLNKLGVLMTNYIVTEILVVFKFNIIIVLIVSLRNGKIIFSIFISAYSNRSVLTKTMWKK